MMLWTCTHPIAHTILSQGHFTAVVPCFQTENKTSKRMFFSEIKKKLSIWNNCAFQWSWISLHVYQLPRRDEYSVLA